MEEDHILAELFSIKQEHIQDIRREVQLKTFEKNSFILKEGQYITVLPLVLEGLVRVYVSNDDKELLLYYIKPKESCVMSFASSLKQAPSKVYAIAEETTKVLLLPVQKIPLWLKKFPSLNQLFFSQYDLRYTEMLETMQHILFGNLETRLYDYLWEKSKLTAQNPIPISHRQIAMELGTAREVVSRMIKKLEQSGKLRQQTGAIEIKGL
ncbi:MAG: Crp/Fnr family transcriptional regulator [Flavobacteriaceae bacterium]